MNSSENNTAIRVLHVGLGVRGRHWLEIVRDRVDMVSVGCMDPEISARHWIRAHAAQLQTACYENLDEALQDVEADAAIIASPPPYHGVHCLRAMEVGLGVLVEKPFTSSIEEALRVAEESVSSAKPVVVAQNYRFTPAEGTLRHLIAQGRIGKVTSTTCVSRRHRKGTGTFLGSMEYAQMMDVAVHHFDSLRSMVGVNGVSVLCEVNNPPGSDYKHGAVTQALIEMEQGIRVQYLGTLTSDRDEHSLWIEGEEGVLWTDRKRVWWRKKGSRFFLPVGKTSVPKGDELPYPREGTTSLLNSLRDAILWGKEPETSARDNLQTLAIVEAGKRSAEEDRRVMIREILEQTSERVTDNGAALAPGEETPIA